MDARSWLVSRRLQAPDDDGKGSAGDSGGSGDDKGGDTGGADKVKEAEDRAKRAEQRARQLELDIKTAEKTAKKAETTASKTAKGADDAATQKVAEAEARVEAALARVKELEGKRIDDAIAGLDDDTKKRVEKYRQSMSSDAFIDMVGDLFGHATVTNGNSDTRKPAPPAAKPMGPMGKLKTQGIELHPETYEVLKRMRGDAQFAERVLVPEHTNAQNKWAIPVQQQIDLMEARLKAPKRMTKADIKAFLDSLE